MPKSIAISVVVALLGVGLFAVLNFDADPAISRQTYISVALAFFNTTAIVCLFYLLYDAEKATAEQFGNLMRNNIATVIVALVINLMISFMDLVGYFF